MRVLVVEDHAALRREMAQALMRLGGSLVVEEACDGAQALDLMRAKAYDLLVTDIVMPVMDGFTLLEALRDCPEPPAKIIVVSALAREDFVTRAVTLGADLYLAKPYEPDALMLSARRLLSPSDARLRPAGQTTEELLNRMLLTLGVPAHVSGYAYLKTGVELAARDPSLLSRITKGLYPAIAQRHGATPFKVERAIRHAVQLAWDQGDVEAINVLFGCRAVHRTYRPSNSELMALLAQRLSACLRAEKGICTLDPHVLY